MHRAYLEAPRVAAILAIIAVLTSPLAFVVGIAIGTAKTDTCPQPVSVIWDNGNQGHNAYASETLTLHLDACSTLVVSSGHLVGPDKNECGFQGDQICVVVFRASTARDVSVTGLDSGHTWYGTTKSSATSALADKQMQLFAPPNCDGTGCHLATILAYRDGVADVPQVIRP